MTIEEIKLAIERALSEAQVFAKSVHNVEGRKGAYDTISLIRRELESVLGPAPE